jgi:hypothetical protein
MRPLRDDWQFNSKYCVADFDESMETSPEVAMGIATFERAINDFILIDQIVISEIKARQNLKQWHRQNLAGNSTRLPRAQSPKTAIHQWYRRFKSNLWDFLFLDEDREYNAYFIAEHCFSGDWYQTLTHIREHLRKHDSMNYSPPWGDIYPGSSLQNDTH